MMVSGLTYDRRCFDSPRTPERYSWVWAAAQAGYATFACDRLGIGGSGKPPAEQLAAANHAPTAYQITMQLRSGAVGGRAFGAVVGIAHSLGAGILQDLTATGADPAGIPD